MSTKMLTELSLEELIKLRSLHPSRKLAEQICPTKQDGYVKTTKNVIHYAWNRSVGLDCKAKGRINEFLMYQGIANNIWSKLPEYAWNIPITILE